MLKKKASISNTLGKGPGEAIGVLPFGESIILFDDHPHPRLKMSGASPNFRLGARDHPIEGEETGAKVEPAE